jgi:hypothetical protein
VLLKSNVGVTSYEAVDELPLVPRQILRVDSLAFGSMPVTQEKSGDIALSSEPESQQV